MGLINKVALGLGALLLIGIAVGWFFQAQIGMQAFRLAAADRLAIDIVAELDDGLHVGLCGTGSPMPSLDRAGPCNVVIAGEQVFIVDIGEGGNEVLNVMGISTGSVDAALLTHFHSDHIDGMGPLMLLHWVRGTASAPLPVYGPPGVEAIVDGFNAVYATDDTYRIAHHGEEVLPPARNGAVARPFEIEGDTVVVLERGELTVTAFRVDHRPVEPAVGYRFDYKGRSVCISGDTDRSAVLEKACTGVDILVHDALQPKMVREMELAARARGQDNAAKVFHDILDYHASPEDAAKSAKVTGARMLVLSHLVPAVPGSLFYPAFLGDAQSHYDGPIVVGEDGMFFTLLPGTQEIERSRLL
jgi:ribonuclease Z